MRKELLACLLPVACCDPNHHTPTLKSVGFSGAVLTLLSNGGVGLRDGSGLFLKSYIYKMFKGTDASENRCTAYFLSTGGLKYQLGHKSWGARLADFLSAPWGSRESLSVVSVLGADEEIRYKSRDPQAGKFLFH